MREQHTPERDAHIALVLKHASPGDILTHTRCMQLVEEHRFTGMDGQWMCGQATADTRRLAAVVDRKAHGSRGYANDIHPINVTHINRIPVAVIELVVAPGGGTNA